MMMGSLSLLRARAVTAGAVGPYHPCPATVGLTARRAISLRRVPAPLRSAAEAALGNGGDAAAAVPDVSTGAAAAAKPPANDDFKGDMLKPSVVNTPLVRVVSVLAAVGAVAGGTMLLPGAFGAFLHVTSYAVLLGTQLWNTFFVGLTMFKNLPRQTFGRLQSKLFPMYFSLTAGSNLLALATLGLAGAGSTPSGTRALVALGVSLAGLVANWLYLEPICTGLMFQRYDIENQPEKTEADKDKIAVLYKEFGKWHGISSLVNLVSFCVTVAHGWYLASLLTL